jgi:hypothetical protein
MANVQTSEVDVKVAPVDVGGIRVIPYLCDSGSHSRTRCLTTVTMETKVRILS